MGVSKTQIDRLGDRLKGGHVANVDLQLLDEYRRSFSDAHDVVINTIRDRLRLQPTGRPAKSTAAIVDKLRRETVRLSQIQDIAGCRLIVPDLTQQNAVTESLRAEFAHAHVVDRRAAPSHGYRAVHVIVDLGGKAVEIQVRTVWQHKWAEFSEKCADAFGAVVKYGGGDQEVRQLLSSMSETVSLVEEFESLVEQLVDLKLRAVGPQSTEAIRKITESREDKRSHLLALFEKGTAIVVNALELRKRNDLSH